MLRKTTLALAAAGALGLPLTAAAATSDSAPAKPQRACFWTSQINNFAAPDEKTVYVRVGVRDVFQLDMLGRCPDVDWNQAIAVRSRGSSHICSGLDAEIISPTPLGPQRCPVKSVRKLTPEEIAALPKRARP